MLRRLDVLADGNVGHGSIVVERHGIARHERPFLVRVVNDEVDGVVYIPRRSSGTCPCDAARIVVLNDDIELAVFKRELGALPFQALGLQGSDVTVDLAKLGNEVLALGHLAFLIGVGNELHHRHEISGAVLPVLGFNLNDIGASRGRKKVRR